MYRHLHSKISFSETSCYKRKYTTSSFTLSEKKTLTNLQKKKLQKSFSSVYGIGTTCFDECFLFHVMTGRHYFS